METGESKNTPILPEWEELLTAAKRALRRSSVYKKYPEDRQTIETVAVRMGEWIQEQFPQRRLKSITFQWAFHEFTTLPIDESEGAPIVRDFFVGELSEHIFAIGKPKLFLNGLFHNLYLELGGREHK